MYGQNEIKPPNSKLITMKPNLSVKTLSWYKWDQVSGDMDINIVFLFPGNWLCQIEIW